MSMLACTVTSMDARTVRLCPMVSAGVSHSHADF